MNRPTPKAKGQEAGPKKQELLARYGDSEVWLSVHGRACPFFVRRPNQRTKGFKTARGAQAYAKRMAGQ